MKRNAPAFILSAMLAASACSSSSTSTTTTGTSGAEGSSSSSSRATTSSSGTDSNGSSTGGASGTGARGSSGSSTGGSSGTSAGSSTGSASTLVAWISDYYGQVVRVVAGTGTVTLQLPATCTPNSVVVNGGQLYVACGAGTGVSGSTDDELLIYDAIATSSIAAAPAGTTVSTAPTNTVTDDNFDSLIGLTFDAQGDAWIASYGNDEVLEITAASLASATPASTVNLVDSPSSPVALAFDSDGSLWVTGQFLGGILLNFTTDQQDQGSNATPRYCMVETGGDQTGCQEATFLGVEGLALFNGDIWVSNNDTGSDGQTPGREIFDIRVVTGQLSLIATYGDTATPSDSPIVCPGGLFATAEHLWVNDESYGESNPACGAQGDVAGATGAIFDFTLSQLGALASQAPAYTNVTGRPGFGGIFIQNDN